MVCVCVCLYRFILHCGHWAPNVPNKHSKTCDHLHSPASSPLKGNALINIVNYVLFFLFFENVKKFSVMGMFRV